MAKRVVILDQIEVPPATLHYVLWATVPQGWQSGYAGRVKRSAWKDASAAENQALRNGEVVELAGLMRVSETETPADIQAKLAETWATFQAAINRETKFPTAGTYLNEQNNWVSG